MSKHTKGWWETGSCMTRVEVLPLGWNAPLCIADCGTKNAPESVAEQVANARLIAAAPEMLETLRYIVNDAPPGEDAQLTVDGYNKACAAIAKAEARTRASSDTRSSKWARRCRRLA